MNFCCNAEPPCNYLYALYLLIIMSFIFLQALCRFFSESHTCLAVESKKELIAIGYKNGKIVVYPLILLLFIIHSFSG